MKSKDIMYVHEVENAIDSMASPGSMKEKVNETKKGKDHSIAPIFFELFANLFFNKKESEKYWQCVLDHKQKIESQLNRDVGIRVAMLDYFSNIEMKLKNPKIVEMDLYENITKAAKEDPKTGLYNSKYFYEILTIEINRAKRNRYKVSLLFIDLDDFKMINDKYGHVIGDKYLYHISKIIKKLLRADDIAARFGGDEFVIMLSHTDKQGAVVASQRLINKFKDNPFIIKDKEPDHIKCNISIGISSYPDNAESSEGLIEKADHELYKSKKSGKNKISFSN